GAASAKPGVREGTGPTARRGGPTGGKSKAPRRGAPQKGKRSPAATSPPTNSSWRAATRASKNRRGRDHGAFDLEGSVRRRLSAQEGGGLALVGPSRDDQDLEPAFDHPAAIRRADLRRLQRPEAHPGDGDRGDGRSQVRRIRADGGVLRPFIGSQGEACGGSRRSGSGRCRTCRRAGRSWRGPGRRSGGRRAQGLRGRT